jgi:LPS O-antigen subunit length determinant protein (WzzB/FepE family)
MAVKAKTRRPARKASRRPAVRPVAPETDNAVLIIIGELRGTLETHIAAVDRDRDEAAVERENSSQYRREVREQLTDLKEGVAQIGPVKKRLDAIEPVVQDWQKKVAVASTIIGGGFVLVAFILKQFGGAILKRLGLS